MAVVDGRGESSIGQDWWRDRGEGEEDNAQPGWLVAPWELETGEGR